MCTHERLEIYVTDKKGKCLQCGMEMSEGQLKDWFKRKEKP